MRVDDSKFAHAAFSTLPTKPPAVIIKQWTPVKGKYRTVTLVAGGADSYHRCTRRARAAEVSQESEAMHTIFPHLLPTYPLPGPEACSRFVV